MGPVGPPRRVPGHAPSERRAGARLDRARLHARPSPRGPAASVLAKPSAGIRDLRHGTIVDGDTTDDDPDGWLSPDRREVPLLADCRHHAVAAGVTRRGDSPVDRLMGDLLVQTTSACGRGPGRRRVDFVAGRGWRSAAPTTLPCSTILPCTANSAAGWPKETHRGTRAADTGIGAC